MGFTQNTNTNRGVMGFTQKLLL